MNECRRDSINKTGQKTAKKEEASEFSEADLLRKLNKSQLKAQHKMSCIVPFFNLIRQTRRKSLQSGSTCLHIFFARLFKVIHGVSPQTLQGQSY